MQFIHVIWLAVGQLAADHYGLAFVAKVVVEVFGQLQGHHHHTEVDSTANTQYYRGPTECQHKQKCIKAIYTRDLTQLNRLVSTFHFDLVVPVHSQCKTFKISKL